MISWRNYILPVILLWVGALCNSGTLSLYAATLVKPLVVEPCGYLANIDHYHFQATYRALLGQPKEWWQDSVVLRRVLYPLWSFPFMQWLGYMRGGFIANLVLHTVTLIVFSRFMSRRLGALIGLIMAYIFATSPGVMYWIGLPYSYASLVPCALLSGLALVYYDEMPSFKRSQIVASIIGILSLGYDLLPYFGVSLLILIVIHKAWKQILPALILLILPTALTMLYFNLQGISPVNANNQSYFTILSSYFSIFTDPLFSWNAWLSLLKESPFIFLHNFFASNFFILPTLFLIFVILGKVFLGVWFSRVNTVLSIVILLVFLVNNLAPTYPGWQMRGYWIARLYQPLFVVMYFYIALVLSELIKQQKLIRTARLLVFMLICLQFTLVVSPLLGLRIADHVYHEFYRHSKSGPSLSETLDRHGRRPMLICRKLRNLL